MQPCIYRLGVVARSKDEFWSWNFHWHSWRRLRQYTMHLINVFQRPFFSYNTKLFLNHTANDSIFASISPRTSPWWIVIAEKLRIARGQYTLWPILSDQLLGNYRFQLRRTKPIKILAKLPTSWNVFKDWSLSPWWSSQPQKSLSYSWWNLLKLSSYTKTSFESLFWRMLPVFKNNKPNQLFGRTWSLPEMGEF